MLLSFLCPYSAAHMALLSMVLAPVSALGDTRNPAVAQQAIASCCKSVHPYSPQPVSRPL